MLFWSSWSLMVASGVLGIACARTAIRQRWPRVAELHIDSALIVFLAVGPVLSAVEHVLAEGEADSLRQTVGESQTRIEALTSDLANAQSVLREFEVEVRTIYSADWKEGHPPPHTSMMSLASKPYASVEIRRAGAAPQSVDFILQGNPVSEPLTDNLAVSSYRARVLPGSPILGGDVRSLLGVERGSFNTIGPDVAKLATGRIEVRAQIIFYANGVEFAYAESKPQGEYDAILVPEENHLLQLQLHRFAPFAKRPLPSFN